MRDTSITFLGRQEAFHGNLDARLCEVDARLCEVARHIKGEVKAMLVRLTIVQKQAAVCAQDHPYRTVCVEGGKRTVGKS